MAKAAKIIGIALAALALLLVGAAILLQTSWAREQIETRLSQQLGGRDVRIGGFDVDWGLPLGIHFEDVSVANAEWAEQPDMLQLDALDAQIEVGKLLTGELSLQQLELDEPRVHLVRQADGRTNWSILTGKTSPDRASKPPIQPDTLRIHNGQLTYRDNVLNTDLTVDIATTDDGPDRRHLTISGQGRLQGKPLALSLIGEPPSQALASGAPYAVTLDARLGDIHAHFDGQASQLPQLDALEGQLHIDVPTSAELSRFAQPPIDVPAFKLDAHVRRDEVRWALKDLILQTGDSRLTGALTYAQGQTPELSATLHGNRLDLNRWGLTRWLDKANAQPADNESGTSLNQRLHQQLLPLQHYAGEIDIRLDQLRYGEATLDDLVVKAVLADQQLKLERLHASQKGGELTASGTLELNQAPLTGELDIKIDEIDLGQALAPFGYPSLGTLDGQLHARLVEDATRLRDTHLRYEAPQQDLWLSINARSTESGLHLEGDAKRNQVPVQFSLDTGPLQALFQDQCFPIEGSMQSQETRFSLAGSVTEPWHLRAAELQVSLKGPNPANLNPLTGLELPDLAPYSLSGQLLWEDRQLRLQSIQARWGESDLSGDVRLSLVGRPMLWANLHSDLLATADLKAPDTPTDPANDQLFSDEPLGLEALRGRDAIVRYDADHVRAKDIPLDAVKLKAELDNGVLVVEPLTLTLGGGTTDGRLRLDLQPQPANGELRLQAKNVKLSPILRGASLSGVAQDSAGTLGGHLDIRFEGQSLGEMAADLNGQLELAMSGGKLDVLAVELLGLDAGEAALAALANSDQVPLNCSYLRFDANQGRAKLAQLFISTRDSNITGGGNIDLDSERIDLTFEAHAKDVSLLSGNSPVKLQGTLSNPEASVVSGELVARALASVAGALVAPPLAILPWLEAGLGEGAGAGCRQVLNEFKQGQ